LKNLYEEKEERASKLEDLTQRLQAQTEDLRRQKELTEAIIETTPVAIIKTNTQGKIDFANTNAQNIFKLSKKDLLSRSIDAEVWKIKNEKGKAINPENLPLQMIQKSFETVHNVVYWVQNGEQNKICLNVSGAPVFDNRGEFVGAVFSIEDITKYKMIEEQLSKYQSKNSQDIESMVSKSLEQMKVQNALHASTHMQNIANIAVLEISKEFKNKLSELMLINQSLQNQDAALQKRLLDSQFEILQGLGKTLEETILYYSEIYSFEALDFYKVMQKNITLFHSSFEAKGITLQNDIPENIYVNAQEGVAFALHLLQSILAQKQSNIVLEVDKKTLLIRCEATDASVDALERLAKTYSPQMLQDIFGKSIQKIAVKTT
jgi:PAS domain S-box-containing protein